MEKTIDAFYRLFSDYRHSQPIRLSVEFALLKVVQNAKIEGVLDGYKISVGNVIEYSSHNENDFFNACVRLIKRI